MKKISIALLLLCLLLLGGCGTKNAADSGIDLPEGDPTSSLGTGAETGDMQATQEPTDEPMATAPDAQAAKPKDPATAAAPNTAKAPDAQSGSTAAKKADPTPAPVPARKATVSISTAAAKGDILAAESFTFEEGDTAFDLLLRLTKDKGIQMDFSGSKTTAYVKAIDNLYEFDKGPSSGWLYFIGGKSPDVSAASYKLKDGDVISWKYIEDFSKVLGPDDV